MSLSWYLKHIAEVPNPLFKPEFNEQPKVRVDVPRAYAGGAATAAAAMLPTVDEGRGYDFQDPHNVDKWRGLFLNSLRKMLSKLSTTRSAYIKKCRDSAGSRVMPVITICCRGRRHQLFLSFTSFVVCRCITPKSVIPRTEAHRLPVEVYNEAAMSKRTCREWFQKFKNGDLHVEDKDRSGRPKIYEFAELEEDLSQTQKELALILEVTQQAVSHHLKSLGMIHKQVGIVGILKVPHNMLKRLDLRKQLSAEARLSFWKPSLKLSIMIFINVYLGPRVQKYSLVEAYCNRLGYSTKKAGSVVLEQVHPVLRAEETALSYVEGLCLRLLGTLLAAPSPLTVQDVEERVARTFPTPLDRWALAEARDSRRRRPLLPADRMHAMLQREVLQYKLDASVCAFIAAILEYVSADILKLAGNYVKKISRSSGLHALTARDVKTAMCADKVLMDMFYQDEELAAVGAGTSNVGTNPPPPPANTPVAAPERRPTSARRGSLTYAELVRDLLTDEKHFLRELHLIIRVFKEEVEKIVDKDSKTIALIFGNIGDIYELTVTLLGNLEDAMEMAQDSFAPCIGSCFEELAEVEEFRAYVRYANTVTRADARDTLQNLADDPRYREKLDSAGHGFRLAVKYYLPRLLLAPVAHVFLYHQYVLALLRLAPAPEDRESFKQVECNLQPITKLLLKALGNGPKMDCTLRMASRARRQLAIEKCNELARLVEHWDTRDIGQCCNEFIREDTLSKIGPGRRVAERRAYLFDGLLVLCKPMPATVGGAGGVGNTAAGAPTQLKLKEKLQIRKIDVHDRPDTEELKNCVELAPRCGPPVVVSCASCTEKRAWLCDLVMLNTKPMLDRTLDSILLPPPHLYRFAVPDSPDNLVLEERAGGGAPLIKGATLLKLVERLTYHIYADPALVRTFLTTYRSFCRPAELLDLLIERFDIPDPSLVYDDVIVAPDDKLAKNSAREDWKRYRKEFQQPVKFRVINVLRHWVDQHFYDFERDPALLERLRAFLESVDGKPMRKWVQSVLKIVQRKSAPPLDADLAAGGAVAHVFDRAPPAILRHVYEPPERYDWHPLALHPLELARQLTLLELHLYRNVRPSELVGAVWTKKDKEKTSPNLLKLIKHTTNFTRWMEKWIVETENLDERAGVVCRLVEVGIALRELNNFNGVLAVVAAMGSASVHRLRHTFALLPPKLARALADHRALAADHFKRYQERLRSINPPCVPFFGMYLTNILHIEDGNRDTLPDTDLINFSKRRKVAEITAEIQQYQNQPYCLTVEPGTRAWLETLDPFPGQDDNAVRDRLYAASLRIEPRHAKQPFKFPRRYPELSVKLVKVSRRQHDAAPGPAHSHNDDTISVSQLSPTSGGAWDGASVASLSLSGPAESSTVVSPRLERSASAAFSLLDRGFGLFDKGASRLASTVSLNRNEPSSPRHPPPSPRHDAVGPAPAPLDSERKPPALSPRSAIVDAECFYSRASDHLGWSELGSPRRHHNNQLQLSDTATASMEEERVPPLLPRAPPGEPSAPPPAPPPPTATAAPPPAPPRRALSPASAAASGASSPPGAGAGGTRARAPPPAPSESEPPPPSPRQQQPPPPPPPPPPLHQPSPSHQPQSPEHRYACRRAYPN
ncbi:Protein son of sevenless [Eumeta japonica]|uniref:Protein son of sevenless n=1 Tax=Eumeta variegata TaxID=151549 RepID=A0A4C1ZJ17_EUMVA|nr:Protein son of sevenless [Eumeta japonica]